MPRKKTKIPPEYQNFKTDLESKGLRVMLSVMYNNNNWCATVMKGKHCIWHNGSMFYDIPLEKFWESKAWKDYELSKAKI